MAGEIKFTGNVLRLQVVGVWNTQLSIPTNGCLKIQNFLLPRLRQLLVVAVSSMAVAHSIFVVVRRVLLLGLKCVLLLSIKTY